VSRRQQKPFDAIVNANIDALKQHNFPHAVEFSIFTTSMNTPHVQPIGQTQRWIKRSVILLAIIAVGALLWQQLPGAAYSTDLTRVGAGRATLVLTQDNRYIGGAEVMELMNGIRADYDGRVDFLVASLALPAGQAFAERHSAYDGTVLLFAGDGRPVGVLHMPRNSDELHSALTKAVGQ
jgi:hypothetical protein